jgi:hypothetical protein
MGAGSIGVVTAVGSGMPSIVADGLRFPA